METVYFKITIGSVRKQPKILQFRERTDLMGIKKLLQSSRNRERSQQLSGLNFSSGSYTISASS